MNREKFLAALKSLQTQTVQTSLNALFTLPRDPSPKNLATVLEALQKLFSDSKQTRLREQMAALFSKQAAQNLSVHETGVDPVTLRKNYAPLFDWLAKKYPAQARTALAPAEDDPAQWNLRLSRIDWRRGDANRGLAIFNQRGCQSCHAVANALGPDLLGVADRFSLNDLFTAIVFPNKDVAPQYRTTFFQMKDGQSYTGIVAFESADGVILQTGANTTLRLAAGETVSRQLSDTSLMPSGLLAGATDQDLADLYGYLRVIERR
jgi:putative heme-binding domain-containing protein